MNCSAQSLAAEAKCLSRITKSVMAAVRTLLLCQYVNKGSAPVPPASTLNDGLIAYFPIPASDDAATSTKAKSESRTVPVDPYTGIVNPVVVAGAGYAPQNLSHRIWCLNPAGEMMSSSYHCPTVTTSVGNGHVSWPGWGSTSDIIIVQLRSAGSVRFWKRIPAATVAAGWTDNAIGWTDAAASSPADFPDMQKRLWYYAVNPDTASEHVSGIPMTQGAYAPNESTFMNLNPYLFMSPGWSFMNTSWTWALLIRPFTGTYLMSVRSGATEWCVGYALINPGSYPSNFTGRSQYTGTGGAETVDCVCPGGLGDFFLMVGRYDAATTTHRLKVFCVNPAHLAAGVEGVKNTANPNAAIAFNDKIEVPLALGGSWAFNVRSGAYHDRLYFWNRSLTDAEVIELYGGGIVWEP